MNRILSIDYGLKRCGLAVTDPMQLIVNGLASVSTTELLDYIRKYCSQNQVEKIVIGYPIQSDGSKGHLAMEIDSLKLKIEGLLNNVQVELYDEKGSSKKAMQIMVQGGIPQKKRADKSLLDKVSAVVILQKFLGHI